MKKKRILFCKVCKIAMGASSKMGLAYLKKLFLDFHRHGKRR
jgi:hypothetical protein